VVEKGLILIFFIDVYLLNTYYRAEGVLGTEAAKIFSKGAVWDGDETESCNSLGRVGDQQQGAFARGTSPPDSCRAEYP
jgi:hypothetical protein